MTSDADPSERWPKVQLLPTRHGNPRAVWQWDTQPNPDGEEEPWRYTWHLLPGRGWPLTYTEEAALRQHLLASDPPGNMPSRDAVTAVMNLLRCGATLEQFHASAPGIPQANLADAYEELEARRAAAVHAWSRIAANPTADTMRRHAAVAAPLLGLPLRRLAPPMEVLTTSLVARRMPGVLAEIDRCAQAVNDVYQALQHFRAPSAAGVELGRTLYDPRRPALWGDPHYLPLHVGSLTPLRVAALLGSAAFTREVRQ